MADKNSYDIVTVGGATNDVFVRCDLSKIMRIEDMFSKTEFMCFSYGSKLNIDEAYFGIGGGALNTAANFANLGMNTSTIVKIGRDISSEAIFTRMKEKGVNTDLIRYSETAKTGFSIILNSFEGDRTVLAHRGANNRLNIDDLDWETIKNTKWIYVSSLSGDSNFILDSLSDFAEEHGVKMAFNPGATQIKRGMAGLKKILAQTEYLILNKEEASMLTGINENYRYIDRNACTGCKTCVDLCPVEIYRIDSEGKAVHFGKKETCIQGCEICVTHCPEHCIFVSPWASNIDEQLVRLKSFGPDIVVITDGGKGVQIYDGKNRYVMATYKVPVKSTLGAGDCFASTFTASMIKTDGNIEKSVRYAAANSASCVQQFGAQLGFKTFEELDTFIEEQGTKNKDINHVGKLELSHAFLNHVVNS